ncbi:MAG TPA: condensation domain-containing protein, partial [Thermoanaerobaculia bacterium]
GVRAVNLAGEPLKGSLAQALYASGVERVRNLYGPSEDTTYSTFEVVERTEPGSRREPTIGRPITGTWVRLLDAELRLVPVGVPGELYIGGAGLARGYLGRPELTAERFVPDDWDTAPGSRLYRTGDLARSLPDGRLEFLGRLDQQVKVRGFRIELGEIETALLAHPGVREAVVVALGEPGGDRSLAAYVVPNVLDGEPAPTAGALRDHLRTRLAEVMVPSSFTRLERLPRTPNGKVNRKALPPPESGADRTDPPDPADPADPITELLAGIWAEVLGRAELPGAQANFFELGGHSLLAARVVSRVRAALGVELPFSALLQTPVLATFAARVEQALTEGRPAPPPIARIAAVPKTADGWGGPLSFSQQRLWFLHRLEPGSAVYNLPLALRLTGPLDAGALERSLDEVFRRHEVLRTTFAEGPDGEPRQIMAPFHPAGLPRVDLAGLSPAAARAEADRQTTREARRPFDLVHGPVARAFLLRLGEQEHHLLVSCHHIAFDGWSAGVLRRELSALYGGSPLLEPAFQYRDFALWQRRWLSGETLAAQLAYWRQRLAGAPGVLELPADRPRPPVQSFRGATLALAVPAGIASLARSEGATLFMTALAAFAALLGRFTGQMDLVVGSPVANRTAAGLDDLLGFFVNTLALRADLAGDPPFRILLGRVRETALSAYAHQDLPFERLVEELQPSRDPSRSPLFQVMLALDLVHEGDLAPGLGCEPLRVDTGTAMFDL